MIKYIVGLFIGLLMLNLAYAANPCRPLAEACSKMGYYRGGNTVGKGLIMDCMMPALSNKLKVSVVMSEPDKAACKSMLEEKIKEAGK
jgi:hypothetical protein